MEGYEDAIRSFEGVHFLAALDAEDEAPDEDVQSWTSSVSDDDLTSEPAAKKLRTLDEWSKEEINTLNPFPFTGDSGMRFTLEHPEPIDLFKCFFRVDFLTGLLDATNHYGKELSLQGQNFGLWRPLSMSELHIFLGLLLHTGTIRMNNLSDYWSSQKLFDVKIFKMSMSKDRFVRVLTALRFGKLASESTCKSDALEPIISYFNSTMESVCYPGRELVIDNCMAVNNGVVVFRENVNPVFAKPELYVHSLSEPNGLVHRVFVSETLNAQSAVNDLMEAKNGRGHSLFLDNTYCSVSLVHELFFKHTFCTGILQDSDKSIPEDLLTAKLTKGSAPDVLFKDPGICLLKWRGRGDVIAISSEFRNLRDNVVNGEAKQKPAMIREYRKYTYDFDRKEFAISYKPMEGKNVGWYRSIIVFFLNLMFKNSFVLFNQNVEKSTFHDFRLSVIENLLKKGKSTELIPSNLPVVEDDVLHVPRKFPKREGQRALRKRCKVCLRDGKRTDSYYHCPQCPNLPALCLERCFAEYHSALKDKIESERPDTTDTEA